MKYFRFIKIEHTLFSLPIVFSGTMLAAHFSSSKPNITFLHVVWIFFAILGARSFGFGINRLLDSDIDKQNPRTKNREIPSGQISLSKACVFVSISALLFLFSASRLSKTALFLAIIPLILFTIYPLLKRWTALCHLGLGLAWGVAPIGGWIAIDPKIFPLSNLAPVLLLSIFCIFWVAGFDMIYALLDEEFDRMNGIYSIPAKIGKKNALRISELFHFFSFIILGILVNSYFDQGDSYLLFSSAGILFLMCHWKVLFNVLTPSVIDFAFFKANAAIGFIIFFLTLTKKIP
ncbi:MAG: hypothetical protein A3I11_00465 [Elusimicrobia bacterium RIFCSPLOWO2_02_FULL_39_32]|nr:MAG: hypothetical protein A3B80_06445 [Elusimicrobia bacterium RIFCSPHIGHO2_02_FULL_39_36]OGR91597.1 MAG: hypothetical protein A3I11_00465 [Elusimicrobia bacterium RIFCSPLOWO2_02_FULL_39_32]OGR98824.1 MAG: hypothetical protein A3G85_08630 [Elusimicrobia bacterium RIFCSPLOWO2_12_FULL_39_28]